MDTQFWVWLIIVVITLLARGLSKKKQGPQQQAPDEDYGEPSQPANKPISFEELLREIQASKAPAKREPEPAKPATPYVDYDDNLGEEERDLEEVEYDYRKQDNIYQVYEDAKQQAFMRPSLETEDTQLAKTDIKFEHFKGYDQESKGTNFAFLAELRDPEGFKKAFIMSEILNRKY